MSRKAPQSNRCIVTRNTWNLYAVWFCFLQYIWSNDKTHVLCRILHLLLSFCGCRKMIFHVIHRLVCLVKYEVVLQLDCYCSSSSSSSDESWGLSFFWVKQNQTFGDEMHGSKSSLLHAIFDIYNAISNRFSKIVWPLNLHINSVLLEIKYTI